jgi:hypothetical protein
MTVFVSPIGSDVSLAIAQPTKGGRSATGIALL